MTCATATAFMPPAACASDALARHRVAHRDLQAFELRIENALGVGMQGRVDLAYDEQARRNVAVKWPSFDSDDRGDVDWFTVDEQIAAIVHEHEAIRLIEHENVLRLYRSVQGRLHNRAYIAMIMEHASNGDLFDWIAATGALPELVAQFYFHQLVLAVQACHAKGVIHRDIKPENLLLDHEFTLKLCDFGLASVVMPAWTCAEDAVLCFAEGTPSYIAPECHHGKPFRATAVDIWACGVVLFIMLTACQPFQRPCAGDVCYDAVLRGDTNAFWAAQSTRPSADAIDLINRMLCADPETRITLSEILAHPWLQDVQSIDRQRVLAIMNERRQMCVTMQ